MYKKIITVLTPKSQKRTADTYTRTVLLLLKSTQHWHHCFLPDYKNSANTAVHDSAYPSDLPYTSDTIHYLFLADNWSNFHLSISFHSASLTDLWCRRFRYQYLAYIKWYLSRLVGIQTSPYNCWNIYYANPVWLEYTLQGYCYHLDSAYQIRQINLRLLGS